VLAIGLLFERQNDLMSRLAGVGSMSTPTEETHYHWREPEEVEAVAGSLTALGYTVDRIGALDALLERWRTNQLLQDVTQELMRRLGSLDYATFDFRIAFDGQAYLLDINADTTLHPQRTLAQVARAAGLSYTQLIEAILKTSLERWQLKP
jgi:D-alanine-D-alanine ligase